MKPPIVLDQYGNEADFLINGPQFMQAVDTYLVRDVDGELRTVYRFKDEPWAQTPYQIMSKLTTPTPF